jgi:hypothetical protein
MSLFFTAAIEEFALNNEMRLRRHRLARAHCRAEGVPAIHNLRLHLLDLNRVLWCRECGEPPFHGWVTTVISSRV